jgi:hypothetical protein
MDMPISQINARLYAQLPQDTGLGLLFATGTAGQIVYASGGRPIQFTLRHAGYALRCKVAPSVELDFELKEGQQIRATGFLNFSSQSAQFHLLCREIELDQELEVVETPEDSSETLPAGERLTPEWLLGIQKRAQAAPEQLAPGDIPDWVKELAPPEAQAPAVEGANVLWGRQRAEAALQPPVEIEVPAPPRLDQDQELLNHLLDALELSEEQDVELTAEWLDQFRSRPEPEPSYEPEPEAEPPVIPSPAFVTQPLDSTLESVQAGPKGVDRWFLLLLFIFFILAAAALALLVST